MAPPRGSAAYKKKDGTLALSKDGQSVFWTPIAPPGSKPTLTLPVSTIVSEFGLWVSSGLQFSDCRHRSPADARQ